MTSLFEQELMAMRQELRDLKTYCARGLGMTRFYSQEITVNIMAQYVYNFTASTLAGEPSPAFTMIFFSVPSPLPSFYVTGSSATSDSRTLSFLSLQDTTIIVRAISTSNLNLTETHTPYV